MELRVSRVPAEEPELLEIRCHKISEDVQEIISFVKSRQGQVGAIKDGQSVEISVIDIFYAEAVDNRVFIYTAKDNYEVRLKLYELEEMIRGKRFLRVQKGLILNLLKIKSIKPALSGRYTALLKNGEEVVISRKYVTDLKNVLKGGELK
jgi:DNA-binding LytR/AlgR family response regulator